MLEMGETICLVWIWQTSSQDGWMVYCLCPFQHYLGHFKTTDWLQWKAIYQFIKPFLDKKKCLFLRNMEPLIHIKMINWWQWIKALCNKSSWAGSSCSKLTTSLVNDSLKFTSSDTQICWNVLLKKMWVAFAVQKLLTFFQQKISKYCVLNLLKLLTKWPLTSSLS